MSSGSIQAPLTGGITENSSDKEIAESSQTSGVAAEDKSGDMSSSESENTSDRQEWPLWEIFVRSQHGLNHRHVGSLHAADAKMAVCNARDVYTRRNEGVSIWVVRSDDIVASMPSEKGPLYEPANSKVYRHPTFFDIPDDIGHM